MSILIIGLSTRAIAESAVRSGYNVSTVDYFGDRDQKELVENYSLKRDLQIGFSADGLLQATRHLSFDGLVYTANLENDPEVVGDLAQECTLLGNEPGVLRQVRGWGTLRAFCRKAGIAFPTTLLHGEEAEEDPTLQWLRKPVRSGGGRGIRLWAGGPVGEDHILQAWIEGLPASAAFVADGERSVVIGLTEQLIGRKALGARGFTWCGNILPLALPLVKRAGVLEEVKRIAARLTQQFGLRGVNGLDLVVADGPAHEVCPFLVEVNPRYTGSMELVEWAYGLNIFSLHLEAMAGRLPNFSLVEHLDADASYFGKGIVYARETVVMPETEGWVERGRRDVPFPGERIEAGHPVCTVLAKGEERATCWNRLLAGVGAVRREIGDETGGMP